MNNTASARGPLNNDRIDVVNFSEPKIQGVVHRRLKSPHGKDFLNQSLLFRKNCYPCTNGKPISLSGKANGNKIVLQALCIISIDTCLIIHVIGYQIKVPIIVEVNIRHAVGDGWLIESPCLCYIGKRQVTISAET